MSSSLPGIETLLRDSWQSYRPRANNLALYMLIQLLIGGGASAVVGLIIAAILLGNGSLFSVNPASFWLLMSLAVALALIVFLLISPWLQGGLTSLLVNPEIKTIEAALRAGWKIKWSVLGAGILTQLAILGGSLLLIVPGVLFAGWFLFSDLLVAKGEKSLAAIKQSKKIVTGRWWSIMMRFVLSYALVVIAPFTVVAFFSVLGEFNDIIKISANALYLLINLVISFWGIPWLGVFRTTLLAAAEKSAVN